MKIGTSRERRGGSLESRSSQVPDDATPLEPAPGDVAGGGDDAATVALSDGVKETFRALAHYEERDVVVPVIASALEEEALRESALSRLLDEQHSRAPRELIRRLHHLDEDQLDRARNLWEHRLLLAARQLLRSDRRQTRANVTQLARNVLAQNPEHLSEVLPILLVLFDDPYHEVASVARHTFIGAILEGSAEGTRNVEQRHPILTALSILLRRFEEHGELDVIRAIFAIGPHGSDLLGRALGEHWAAGEEIVEVAEEMGMPVSELDIRIEGLLRWLESPYQDVRDTARRILRERATEAFLLRCAFRFESAEARVRTQEYPAFRHMRWDRIPTVDLRRLAPKTIDRLAGYVSASAVSVEEKARRLARLLAASCEENRVAILERFVELPTNHVLLDLERFLRADAENVQLLATRLLPDTRQGTALLIGQLRSQHESVRDNAQERLKGRSLRFYFESFESFSAQQRCEILRVIQKIDTTFFAQLRHALRSDDEETVIRALLAASEIGGALGDRSRELEDAILDLTVTPSARVRATLARTLAVVSAEPRRHYLRLFLDDDDPRVVANAIDTIGGLDDAELRSWLEEKRSDPHRRVRTNALLALTRLGDARARDELRSLSQSSDVNLATSARWAEAQITGAN